MLLIHHGEEAPSSLPTNPDSLNISINHFNAKKYASVYNLMDDVDETSRFQESFSELMKHKIESFDSLQGVIINYNALSPFNSILFSEMKENVIFAPKFANSITDNCTEKDAETLNMTYSMSHSTEEFDLVNMVDLARLTQTQGYSQYSQLSKAMCSLVSGTLFSGRNSFNLSYLVQTLVTFPRIKFMAASYAQEANPSKYEEAFRGFLSSDKCFREGFVINDKSNVAKLLGSFHLFRGGFKQMLGLDCLLASGSELLRKNFFAEYLDNPFTHSSVQFSKSFNSGLNAEGVSLTNLFIHRNAFINDSRDWLKAMQEISEKKLLYELWDKYEDIVGESYDNCKDLLWELEN
eukprot:CAMPEP_0170522342 /NCGR_PEP_ID=MMETSP0209-20121228/7767_1 /TAXON_ID=665100 ORGANISM="Litonotus pictus, Strain P1" /NCGR_SAMPLE_ID=MMETSP0209 /ASSEMBLY_ACC=CAM_ASM_000301 /LENGTH=349 /DNA_ID=CAMNT_0010809795 /DNA_START=352 /DNA_END=1401 /DNA_ORIENTATION=+